jgi:hypothetical protein
MAAVPPSPIDVYLVPGRSCDACTACCTHLLIDDPELTKAAGSPCPHCSAGCTIYETRPQTCRNWYCGWRQMPELGEDWRPDRSDVLIRTDVGADGTPEVYFQLIGRLDVVNNPNLANVIAGMIVAGIRVLLVPPGPVGHVGIKVPLNEGLLPAIRRNDLAGVLRALNGALATGLKAVQEQVR